MDSSTEQTLCFVSWNICGQKNPNNDHFSKKLKAEIFFLQETKIGPESDMPLEKLDDWKSFFTVYDSSSKGVAILIKNSVHFQYIRHDEDYSGGYLVLFCRLYGELFTLVNVYNHKDDTEMLNRLQEYLREVARGVLVVGGDFNTVLDLSCDRASKTANNLDHTQLWSPLKKFITSLNLMDTWAYFKPTVKAFTYSQNDSYSRLDMFLLCEDNMERIKEVNIQKAKKPDDQIKNGKDTYSDHLLLLICLKVNKIPNTDSQLQLSFVPDKRAGKINGAEILSVIKSLTDSGHERHDGICVQTYKYYCRMLSEILKKNFNSWIKSNKLPPDFSASLPALGGIKHFNVDYLIFTMILAKRLHLLLEVFPEKKSQTNTCDLCYCVGFAEKPRKIRWTFSKDIISHIFKTAKEEKKDSEKDSKTKMIIIVLKGLVPLETKENTMLEAILPEASDDFRELQDGCPLTRSILSLVLKYLELQINERYKTYKTHRQAVVIHENSSPDLTDLLEKFMTKSGIKLKCFQLEANLQTS